MAVLQQGETARVQPPLQQFSISLADQDASDQPKTLVWITYRNKKQLLNIQLHAIGLDKKKKLGHNMHFLMYRIVEEDLPSGIAAQFLD